MSPLRYTAAPAHATPTHAAPATTLLSLWETRPQTSDLPCTSQAAAPPDLTSPPAHPIHRPHHAPTTIPPPTGCPGFLLLEIQTDHANPAHPHPAIAPTPHRTAPRSQPIIAVCYFNSMPNLCALGSPRAATRRRFPLPVSVQHTPRPLWNGANLPPHALPLEP